MCASHDHSGSHGSEDPDHPDPGASTEPTMKCNTCNTAKPAAQMTTKTRCKACTSKADRERREKQKINAQAADAPDQRCTTCNQDKAAAQMKTTNQCKTCCNKVTTDHRKHKLNAQAPGASLFKCTTCKEDKAADQMTTSTHCKACRNKVASDYRKKHKLNAQAPDAPLSECATCKEEKPADRMYSITMCRACRKQSLNDLPNSELRNAYASLSGLTDDEMATYPADWEVPLPGIARHAFLHGDPDQRSAGRRRYGDYRWQYDRPEMESALSELGLEHLSYYKREQRIIRLAIADAERGLLPIPRPLLSRYHNMESNAAIDEAVHRGLRRASLVRDVEVRDDNLESTAAQAIQYLIQNDHENDVDYWAAVREDDRQAITDLLANDLVIGVQLGLLQPANRANGLAARDRRNPNLRAHEVETLREIRHGNVVGLTGEDAAIRCLEPLVYEDMMFPTETSSEGFLCGVYALEESLHTMRMRDYRLNGLERANSVNDLPPTRITHGDMMAVLFRDWTPDQQHDPARLGTPTEEYRQYLHEHFHDGTADSEQVFWDFYEDMMRMSDLDAIQLQAILTLLHRARRTQHDYALGVVASTYIQGVRPAAQQVPPNARFVDRFDPSGNRPALFVHNNITFGDGRYNHWEGMTDGGAGDLHAVLSWGLRIADAPRMPRFRFWASEAIAEETETSRAKRLKTNERRNEANRILALRKACLPCAANGQRCNGDATTGLPCQNCVDSTQPCSWPPDQAQLPTTDPFVPSQLYTKEKAASWDTHPGETFEGNTHFEKVPEDKKHSIIVHLARHSSHPGEISLQDAARRLQVTAHHYRNMLRAGVLPINQTPVGTPPPGVLVSHCIAFARHGAMPVPTTLDNLNNAELIPFVQELHRIFAYGQQQPIANPPAEIQFVLTGLAGFSVGIRRWGSRAFLDGLFAFAREQDRIHGTNLTDLMYVVVHVEYHNVDGVSPGRITPNLPQGTPTPNWELHKHRALHKEKLADLVDRNAYLQMMHHHNALLVANGQAQQPLLNHQFTAAQVRDLDTMIAAMHHEELYRTAQLDGTTVPTALNIRRRNHNRNLGMRNRP